MLCLNSPILPEPRHPNGPFHLHHAFHPNGLPSLDVSLYQLPADDGQGGKARRLPLRAIDNKYIGASKLRDDFLDVTGEVSILTRGRREAPTLFRSNGLYRLLVTETEGWTPSRLHLLNGTHGLLPQQPAAETHRPERRRHAQTLFRETRNPAPANVKAHSTRKCRPSYTLRRKRAPVLCKRTSIRESPLFYFVVVSSYLRCLGAIGFGTTLIAHVFSFVSF